MHLVLRKEDIQLAKLSKGKLQFILLSLIIPVTLLGLFVIYPLFNLIYMSFTDYSGLGDVMNFNGLENYVEIFTQSPNLWVSLANNMKYLLVSTVFIPIELVLAAMFTTQFTGSKFFKSLVFMPYIVNGVAIAYTFSYFLSPINGGLNSLLELAGLDFLIQSWLSDVNIVGWTLPFITVWKWSGYHIILFSAALMSVPGDVIEAAIVDGATPFQVFTKIQLPSIKMILEFVLFTVIAGSIQVFDMPFVMTGGGPGYASSTFAVYTINTAFTYSDFGKASAMAIIMIFMVIILNVVQLLVRKLFSKGGR